MGQTYTMYYPGANLPDIRNPPTFDPMYGFPNGRKERVMIATPEEMESAKLPLDKRDYCAHKLLDYLHCLKDVWPFAYKCAHYKHVYGHCEFEDYVLRLKEFEREKRLLERQKRKHEREQREGLTA